MSIQREATRQKQARRPFKAVQSKQCQYRGKPPGKNRPGDLSKQSNQSSVHTEGSHQAKIGQATFQSSPTKAVYIQREATRQKQASRPVNTEGSHQAKTGQLTCQYRGKPPGKNRPADLSIQRAATRQKQARRPVKAVQSKQCQYRGKPQKTKQPINEADSHTPSHLRSHPPDRPADLSKQSNQSSVHTDRSHSAETGQATCQSSPTKAVSIQREATRQKQARRPVKAVPTKAVYIQTEARRSVKAV